MDLYGNTDAALLIGTIFGASLGFIFGHARGFKIGKREGIVRGKIMARSKADNHASI